MLTRATADPLSLQAIGSTTKPNSRIEPYESHNLHLREEKAMLSCKRFYCFAVALMLLLAVNGRAQADFPLGGGWACLGRGSTSATPPNNVFNFVMQLKISHAGNTSGLMFLNFSSGNVGEVSDLPITSGSLAVVGGIGKMAFTVTCGNDEDSDLCPFLPGDLNFDIVEASVARFYFIGRDNFFGGVGDNDSTEVNGVCDAQSL